MRRCSVTMAGPLLATALLAPVPASAQWPPAADRTVADGAVAAPGAGGTHADHDPTPGWVDVVGWSGANALIGGVTAAMSAWLGGHEVPRAFLAGAIGGGTSYLGKRIATAEFRAAGLAGRQVAAFGSNLVANGGRGAPLLDELWLPLGPVWFQLGDAHPFEIRPDLVGGAVTVWAMLQPRLRLDPAASLFTGTLVYTSSRRGGRHAGFAAGGVVAVLDPGVEDIRTHELIHVLQQDMFLLAVSRPAERALLGVEPPIDLGTGRLLLLMPWSFALAEAEAERLTGH